MVRLSARLCNDHEIGVLDSEFGSNFSELACISDESAGKDVTCYDKTSFSQPKILSRRWLRYACVTRTQC